ncbi:hypothetical protein ACFE04_004272 [Oxalis oulophora]
MSSDRASPQSSEDSEGFTLHFGGKFYFKEELNVVDYVVENDEDLEELVVDWALDRKIEVYVEAAVGSTSQQFNDVGKNKGKFVVNEEIDYGFEGDSEDGGCSNEELLDDVSFCSEGGDDEFTELINNVKSYTVDIVIEEIRQRGANDEQNESDSNFSVYTNYMEDPDLNWSMSDNDECVNDNAAGNDNAEGNDNVAGNDKNAGNGKVLAKERKKQAEKSVEREAVATENEVNLADNGSSWDGNGHGNVEQSSLAENLLVKGPINLSAAAPGDLSREESERPSEAELETGAGEEPGTSSEHIIAPPRTGQTVGSTSRQTVPPNNVRSTSQPTGPSNAPTNNVRSTSQPSRPSNTIRSTSQPSRPSNNVRSTSQPTRPSNSVRSTSHPNLPSNNVSKNGVLASWMCSFWSLRKNEYFAMCS